LIRKRESERVRERESKKESKREKERKREREKERKREREKERKRERERVRYRVRERERDVNKKEGKKDIKVMFEAAALKSVCSSPPSDSERKKDFYHCLCNVIIFDR
jgi:hypothetical protein